MFQGCNFVNWDVRRAGEFGINANAGRLTVSSCNFKMDGKEILIGEGVESAVVMGNHVTGAFDIENHIGQRAQIGLNVGVGGVNKSLMQLK